MTYDDVSLCPKAVTSNTGGTV